MLTNNYPTTHQQPLTPIQPHYKISQNKQTIHIKFKTKEQQHTTTLPALHRCVGTPKMGRPWRNSAKDHTDRVLSIFLIAILLVSLLFVDPFRYHSTMGITMRAAISKEEPTRTTITSKQVQRTTCLSKSPCSDNVNLLLAEINLPTSHFDNVLEAPRSTMEKGSDKQGNTLDNPCNLEPPADKDNQMTPIASPTGVDTFTLGAPFLVDNADPAANKDLQDQQTPSTRGVRINEMAIQVEALMTPARSLS
jgi:hypothetical protein